MPPRLDYKQKHKKILLPANITKILQVIKLNHDFHQSKKLNHV